MVERHWGTMRAGLALPVIFTLVAGCAVTPDELGADRMSAVAAANVSVVQAGQEPVRGPIDLYEAIARALKHNLDHRVEIAELSLRERELRLAHFSMLPDVVANSGYAARDSFHASNSVNILTGVESLATSTSQDKALRTSDVAFGWNILDFGLSYVRARQAADRVLIQNELRRKVKLRLIEDTQAAYWRAVSAQRLLGRLSRVERDARAVEREAHALARDGTTAAITAHTYVREVIEIQRKIAEVVREMNSAKAELGALMNLPPGTRFALVDQRREVPTLARTSMGELLHTALVNRPELREVELKKRINEQEAHAAMLELLPGLNLIVGSNFDSNSFLFTNNWANWGARASWNLIRVFSYPARRDVVDEQERLLKERSLAVTMAIMTQVYVSRVRYAHAIKEYRIAQRYRDVQGELLKQLRSEAAAGRVSRQTLVREELNALIAEARMDLRFAGLRAAFANMQTSLGLDPFDLEVIDGSGVGGLAAALRSGRVVDKASLVMAQK